MGSRREKHKKKSADKQRPNQTKLINIPVSNGTCMQVYGGVNTSSTIGNSRHQFAVGIWQHPQTELWQVWCSVAGNDITWISAHRDPKEANQNVEELKLAHAQGDFFSKELFQRLLQTGTAPPENMSVTEIEQIIAFISRET